MNESNNRIAQEWLKAFNNHDLEELLKLYHEEAHHFSPKLKLKHPETKGLIAGKKALANWWQEAFDRLPDLQYKVMSITSNKDRVWMEYKRQTPGEEDLMVAEVLEIESGLIVASRVYHG